MTSEFDPELRFRAACAALQGLLADTEDQADERRQEEREVDERSTRSIPDMSEPTGRRLEVRVLKVKKMVYTETCAEATARLAIEHADALLRALK